MDHSALSYNKILLLLFLLPPSLTSCIILWIRSTSLRYTLLEIMYHCSATVVMFSADVDSMKDKWLARNISF